ncbi:hypothetical protein SUDANB121_01206 [Nocardiopsis dassonvillei]|uniref:hypothetical protein n=1 Tax=Nocardiopsis dassonvillei TaxID=2014 RepID=UPI003F56E1D7
MSWSNTSRRNAVEGLAVLLGCDAWRSAEGERLRADLFPFSADRDDACRLFAAQVASLLDPDPARALDMIHRRLKEEPVFEVGGTLAVQLGRFVNEFPSLVDQVVYDAAFGPWLEPLDDEGAQVDIMFIDGFVQIVLFLALHRGTPNARSLASSWFGEPTESQVCDRALLLVRDFLAGGDAEVRERAAGLLLTATAAVERLRLEAEPGSEELRKAFLTASEICTTVHLAAEGHRDPHTRVSEPPEGLLSHVLPILRGLTGFREPSIVHDIVKTLACLAPQDPRAVLGCLRGTVHVGDPYAYDSLAQRETIALCARYLAEFWEDIMDEPDSLTALREVIGVFVHAGWPEAIGLSRRLGEAFR